MAYSVPTKPIALGKLAPTAGTPIRCTANLADVTDGAKAYGNTNPATNDLWVNKLEFKAPVANAGNVFIGFSGMNTTTLAGVLRILEPGESWGFADPSRSNVYRAGDYMVDVATNGDSCHGSVDVV